MRKKEYKNLIKLSKEQLIKIIEDYDRLYSVIGEVCVSESKCHDDSSNAIDKIRKYLCEGHRYALYNEHLDSYVDMLLGNITSEEYREIKLKK